MFSKFYSKNKALVYSLLFLGVYSTTLVFAAPPATPYLPSDNITDPACAPGSTNCYVSIGALPVQTGNTNRLLFTDGTDTAWISGVTWDETTDVFTVATGTNKTLLIDPANNVYKFGDIDNKNNNTYLNIDDANNDIKFFTELSGTTFTVFRMNPLASNTLDNEIFLGVNAGSGAVAAYHSNFMGYRTGESADNAAFSNFFGYRAGENADNATNSNFFGQRAGNLAVNGSYSNLFGFNAGNSTIGSNNIVIGTNITLPNATTNGINIGGILFGTGAYSTITGNPSSDPVAAGRIGIGTNNPSGALEIMRSNSAPDTYITRYQDTSGGSSLIFQRSRGLSTAATALQASDKIGLLQAVPHDGTSFFDVTGQIMFQVTPGGSISTGSVPTDIVFSAGTSAAFNVNQRMRIASNGNVGIGIGNNTNPAYRLEVVQDSASYAASIFNDGNNDNRFGLLIQAGADAPSAGRWIQFNDGDGGSVGTVSLVTGTLTLTTTSDQRLKQNITDTSIGINALRNIKVRDFSFISDPAHRTVHGFIAQELYEAYPDAVIIPENTDQYWQVAFSQLTPLIIKSIQDVDVRVQDLQSLDADKSQTLGALIRTFLSNTANGLQRIFVKEICVDEATCLTKEDIQTLIMMSRERNSASQSPQPDPEVEIQEELVPEENVSQEEDIPQIETVETNPESSDTE